MCSLGSDPAFQVFKETDIFLQNWEKKYPCSMRSNIHISHRESQTPEAEPTSNFDSAVFLCTVGSRVQSHQCGWQEVLTPDREDGEQLLCVTPVLSHVDSTVERQSPENPHTICDCPEHDHSAGKCCVPSRSSVFYKMAQGTSVSVQMCDWLKHSKVWFSAPKPLRPNRTHREKKELRFCIFYFLRL